MDDNSAKAAGFISLIAVLREDLGDRFAKVHDALPAETQALVDKPPMPMSWMSQHHFESLLDAIWRLGVGESADAITRLSRKQMTRDMSTIYKVLMHLASTEAVIKKSSTIYSTYTKNGVMSSRELGPKHAEITLQGMINPTPAWWAYQRGAILGVLDAAGTKAPEVVIKEGGGTQPNAVFDISWA